MKKLECLMPPLWLMYPQTSQFSIGWRMGYGEGYKFDLYDWLDSLDEAEQEEWKRLFPYPKSWVEEDYLDESEGISQKIYEADKHCIVFWNEYGRPAYALPELKEDVRLGKKLDYLFFWGHQPSKDGRLTSGCFSQWWQGRFQVDRDTYYWMEQYMMAEKARLFGDEDMLEEIMSGISPQQIKALGRKVKGFDEKTWDKCKYSIVLNGNYHKFMQNIELRDFLLASGNRVLVEASPYDAVWGIRMNQKNPDIGHPLKWKGSNLLGFALMEVRAELARVCENADRVDWRAVRVKYE